MLGYVVTRNPGFSIYFKTNETSFTTSSTFVLLAVMLDLCTMLQSLVLFSERGAAMPPFNIVPSIRKAHKIYARHVPVAQIVFPY